MNSEFQQLLQSLTEITIQNINILNTTDMLKWVQSPYTCFIEFI